MTFCELIVREVRKQTDAAGPKGAPGGAAPPELLAGLRAELSRTAFLALPRSVRLLYAHSYVDRVWNFCASERASRHGTAGPVAGDLVKAAAEPCPGLKSLGVTGRDERTDEVVKAAAA